MNGTLISTGMSKEYSALLEIGIYNSDHQRRDHEQMPLVARVTIFDFWISCT